MILIYLYMKTVNQVRHEKIVDLIKDLPEYKDVENFVSKEQVPTNQWVNLSIDTINFGVHAFVDLLNLGHGSDGMYDLYALLQVYLKYPEKTKQINNIILTNIH